MGGAKPRPTALFGLSIVLNRHHERSWFTREADTNPIRLPVPDSIVDSIDNDGVHCRDIEILYMGEGLIQSNVDERAPVVHKLLEVSSRIGAERSDILRFLEDVPKGLYLKSGSTVISPRYLILELQNCRKEISSDIAVQTVSDLVRKDLQLTLHVKLLERGAVQ
jgi:hypothetical protein